MKIAAKAGLVDLYGQAWRTSGTAKMDGDAMDDLLEAKAAHIETEGDEDSTSLSWDSLKGDADQVFALAMDLLFHPEVQRRKSWSWPSSRRPRASCAATTTRIEIADASRPSWSTAPTVPTRGSRSWRPSPRSRCATCRRGTTARSRQADCRHRRRLRSCGDGGQGARGL